MDSKKHKAKKVPENQALNIKLLSIFAGDVDGNLHQPLLNLRHYTSAYGHAITVIKG